MDKSCQLYGNFHIGNHNIIAGRRAYIAVKKLLTVTPSEYRRAIIGAKSSRINSINRHGQAASNCYRGGKQAPQNQHSKSVCGTTGRRMLDVDWPCTALADRKWATAQPNAVYKDMRDAEIPVSPCTTQYLKRSVKRYSVWIVAEVA